MSFHVVPKRVLQPGGWSRSYVKYVALKLHSNGYRPRVHITVSGDLIAHLQAQAGDCVRILKGYGEDAGDFAIERSAHRDSGARKLVFQRNGRCAYLNMSPHEFPSIKAGTVTVYNVELAEGRVICRAPDAAALAQAAE